MSASRCRHLNVYSSCHPSKSAKAINARIVRMIGLVGIGHESFWQLNRLT